MARLGILTQCRTCGEIYNDNTERCPFCDAPCNPLGAPAVHPTPPPPTGRVERWAQKLLDLSRANRLLNLRDSKRVIPLYCPDLGKLEDAVAANKPIEIDSLANLLNAQDYASAIRQSALSPILTESLTRELAQKRLWTPLPPPEIKKRLYELYRLARQDLEESGVNTLFLGLGFLEWCPADEEETFCRAPILLVPIRFVRKSISKPIRLLRLDAETVLNATLIELLRAQFGIVVPEVSPLPTDTSGVDVPIILDRFRQAIALRPGWRVIEEVVAGQFSFGKFVMWKDLTTRMEKLGQHPLVRHFIDGEGFFDDGIELTLADAPISPTDFLCPLSADSTQLAAVNYAAKGKTFVLHGPPGTGKSQTIANIIANTIAHGQKVLFVSEKKAALDVVYSRLQSVGLAPFCLELHSNKSGKRHVLKQFSKTLEVPQQTSPRQWRSTLSQFNDLQQQLDGDLAHLHRIYPNGQSGYDCLLRLIDLGSTPYATAIKFCCTQQNASDLAAMMQTAEALAQAAEVADLATYPALEMLRVDIWTPMLNIRLSRHIEQLQTGLTKAATAVSALAKCALPSVRFETLTLGHCANLARLAEASQPLPPVELLPLLDEHLEAASRTLRAYAIAERKFDQAVKSLAEYNLEAVEICALPHIQAAIADVARSIPLLRPLKRWWILQRIPPVRKPNLPPLTFTELTRQLPNFCRYQKCLEEKRLLKAEVSTFLGKLFWEAWPRLRTNLESSLNSLNALSSVIEQLFPGDATRRQRALQELREHLQQGGDPNAAINCHYAWRDFMTAIDEAEPVLTLELDALTPESFFNRLNTLKNAIGSLRNGLRLHEAVHAAEAYGLAEFASALLAGSLAPKDLVPTLKQAYATKMFEEILAQEPSLAHFSGATREQKIELFAQLDRKLLALTAKKIVAKLSEKIPNLLMTFGQGKHSPLAILKHECEKQRCHLPVRLLLSKIGELAHLLKPCFLMSPLSVAQYLPAETEQFDLLIFDEASQIPVWDAIGTIARCRQVIVVGDPKQMPPTNFFHKENPENEKCEEEIEDLESILDECLASGLFATHLAWHYRSRHESLIAFSNHHYYNNRLLTFPAAANTPTLGIQFRFVPNGLYDRTHSRTNYPEAIALVEALFKLLQNAPTPRRSIGVVTFNEPQKCLIEELIEQRRVQEPNFEEFFQEECEAPFFVKNLENVQGDERDLILFSVGYAPDAAGKFLMNFGPLNRKGGERRLNVAITRAKEQILLFSSIHATQIDLSRTTALGVTHLHEFIDYAEHLSAFPLGETPAPEKISNEPFIDTIEDFLQSNGYQTVRDFGRSERKIDLAIRDPRSPQDFLIAIEVDGPAYAGQTFTRDRESLRPAILKGLGWNLIHVWSLDWTFDRSRAEARLLEAIQTCLSAPTVNDC